MNCPSCSDSNYYYGLSGHSCINSRCEHFDKFATPLPKSNNKKFLYDITDFCSARERATFVAKIGRDFKFIYWKDVGFSLRRSWGGGFYTINDKSDIDQKLFFKLGQRFIQLIPSKSGRILEIAYDIKFSLDEINSIFNDYIDIISEFYFLTSETIGVQKQ